MDSITTAASGSFLDLLALTSIHHIDLSRALVEAFLNVAAKKDRDLAAMLLGYYDAALTPANPDPNLSQDQRYEAKRVRTEALRRHANDLVEELRYDPRLPRFADWNDKAAWLADFIGPMLAKENYFDIARAIVDDFYARRKQYYEVHKHEPGFNIDNFVFDSPYVPQFNERLFHPEDVAAVYNNQFGNGYVKWIFRTPQEFFDIIEQIREYIIFTPHPIEGKTRSGNANLIEIGKESRTLAMVEKGGDFAHAAMREAGLEHTMHPHEFALHTMARLTESLDRLVDVEFTPVDENKNIRRFAAREELAAIGDSAEAAWQNGHLRYRSFDRTLTRTFDPELYPDRPEKHYTPEHRLFHLRKNVASWGPDKDGHEGKRHEHRLVEEVLELHIFVKNALADFSRLETSGITFEHGDYPEVRSWLIHATQHLAQIDEFLLSRETESGDVPLTQAEIIDVRRHIDTTFTLSGESESFTHVRLREQLLAITHLAAQPAANWRELPPTEQQAAWGRQTLALALYNNVRDFAPHMAHLEGRNNVKEFREVLAYILAEPHPETGAYLHSTSSKEAHDYYRNLLFVTAKDPVEQRALDHKAGTVLDRLVMQNPEEIQVRVAAIRTRLKSEELRDLAEVETQVCHTLNSIERALGVPNTYPRWVQAEYEGPKDTLVFIALQNALGPQLKPSINQISLVESLETLAEIPDYLSALYLGSPTFRRHKWLTADHKNKTIEDVLQLASSDNTRSSGNLASRCALRRAHDLYHEWFIEHEAEIKALFKADGYDIDDYHFVSVPYQGKSEHHVSRAGARANSALSDAYGTHKRNERTQQGPDAWLVGRFPPIAQREDSGFWSHSAKAIAWQEATGETHSGFAEIENVVIESGLKTKTDFETHYYNSEKNLRGYAAACPAFDYPALGIVAAGNRPPKRGSKGAEETVYAHPEKGTAPIDLMKIRAIGDVEHQFDMEIHGGWFAAKNWESHLYNNFHHNDPDIQGDGKGLDRFMKEAAKLYKKRVALFEHDTQSLTTEGAVLLYKRSPMFRENVDIAGYGLVVTDLDEMEAKYAEAIERFGMPDLPQTRAYLNHLVEDAYAASLLVLKSFGINPRHYDIDEKSLGINRLGEFSDTDRTKARKAVALARSLLKDEHLPALNLSHLNEELDPKRDIAHLAQRIFFEMNMEAWDAGQKGIVDEARRQHRNLTRRHAWVARTAKSHGAALISRDPPYKMRKQKFVKDHPERAQLRVETRLEMQLTV